MSLVYCNICGKAPINVYSDTERWPVAATPGCAHTEAEQNAVDKASAVYRQQDRDSIISTKRELEAGGARVCTMAKCMSTSFYQGGFGGLYCRANGHSQAG